MSFSLIVAMTARQVIGRAGQLPWHLPADLRRFRRLTMGHHVILGRKTYESIGRPLPGRKLVVLSRQADLVIPGARVAADLRKAVELCHDDQEPFCAGGQQVYRDALELADRIYLTLVHADVDGDAYFPTILSTDWRLVHEEHRQADERNAYDLTFQTLQRDNALALLTTDPGRWERD
jgi:dihydrofolate reductase